MYRSRAWFNIYFYAYNDVILITNQNVCILHLLNVA